METMEPFNRQQMQVTFTVNLFEARADHFTNRIQIKGRLQLRSLKSLQIEPHAYQACQPEF